MPIENVLFPLVLLLWPLVKITQGVDVSDTTYSLGNYMFPHGIQPMWIMSTYLSNAIGSVFVRLPGGDTLLGMNIYGGLVMSAIALIAYYSLRKDFTAPVLFMGEFLAISFCWIPTGIFYNYLTYLFFTVAAILIYKALKKNDGRLLLLAGLVLGLNLFIRIPNITECALILAVWFVTFYSHKYEKVKATGEERSADRPLKKCMQRTIYCIAGYIVGAAIPFCAIILNYGFKGISDMLAGLNGVTNADDTYTPLKMFTGILEAYWRSARWITLIVLVVGVGTAMFAVFQNKLKWLKKIIYVGVMALLIRFFWGRGMFSLRYYEDYTAMYEWGMIALFISIAAIIVVLIKAKDYNRLVYAYAWISLVMIIITPLGSNNTTYQNLNNLFMVMPFTVYVVGGWMYRGAHRLRLEGMLHGCNFPWMSMVLVLFLMIFVQSSLFHLNFVFRDGMRGEERDTQVEGVDSLRGMYTNRENAEAIEEASVAVTGASADSAIFWGDCPGLSYIFRIPSAINTTWPSLDSYSAKQLKGELSRVEDSDESAKVIIICRKMEDYSDIKMEKQIIMDDFIKDNAYKAILDNSEYTIYLQEQIDK